MCVYNRTEQFPGAATPVHAHHAQYLKESQATQRARSEHLPRGAHA